MSSIVPLAEALAAYSPDFVVLRHSTGTWSVAQWRHFTAEARAKAISAGVQGRIVSLRAANLSTVLLLPVLDGLAAGVVLLSPALDPPVASALEREAGVEAVIEAPAGSHPSAFRVLPEHGANQRSETSAGPTRWMLPTSGTTSQPKLVAHTMETLCRTVKRDRSLGVELVWGLLYDPCRFAGLQVVLQSLHGGSALAIADPHSPLEDNVRGLLDAGCSALSGTPTLWRKILMTPGSQLLDLKQVTLGGEIVDQSILDALGRRYPQARIVHIYASTEAGVGFAVADRQAGFPASYLGSAPGGVRLGISPHGTLLMRSSLAATTPAGAALPGTTEDGFIDTGDVVSRIGERIYFQGRANGTINVGGDKIQPEEIEQVVLAIPGVHLARARGRRNSITGHLVELLVVPEKGIDPSVLRIAVLAECQSRLPRHKVPALIHFTDDLGLSQTGKIGRAG